MRPILILLFSALSLSAPCLALSDSSPVNPADYPSALRGAAHEMKSAVERKDKERITSLVQQLRGESYGRGTEDERLFLVGFGAFQLESYDQATEALRKSLEERESNPHAHYYLALALLKSGKCEESLRELRGVQWLLGRNNPDALILQAECLAKLGRSEESSLVMKNVMEIANSNPELRTFLLKSGQNEHKFSVLESTAAAMDIREAALANPADEALQKLYGRSLLTKGDPLLARRELEEAREIAARSAEQSGYRDEEAVKLLFDSLLKQRKFSEAELLIEKALGVLPESVVFQRAKKQLAIEKAGLQRLTYSTDSN